MASSRKRLLFVQPSLQPPGGGNSVAVFMIQALRDQYDLTLFTWVPVDLDELNRYYDTDLRPDDYLTVSPNPATRRALNAIPFRLNHLKRALMAREVLRIHRDFDIHVTAYNEMDLGCRAIQYIHFPANFLPRPSVDINWYHRIPGILSGYHALVNWISHATTEGLRSNLTLANSKWTAAAFRRVYGEGCDVRVLYPPVRGRRSPFEWSDRSDDFVCIGRISPEKRVECVVDILEKVRAGGWSGRLHLIGHPDNRRYWHRIRKLIGPKPWIQVHFDIARAELNDLVARSRYGIHGMEEEHFGISVAEMAMAGCVVFVPKGGGQIEIVDSDPRSVYESPEDAVAKIRRVLDDSDLQREISITMARRGTRFTAEEFMERTREIVREFVEANHR